ncbi:MAG TPA: retropepsin-like aspartic protease [Gemmatimonadaceae bacterium]|nr:retropepsin-like aspartic protease [Gemmatimonadaceae bacterium]
MRRATTVFVSLAMLGAAIPSLPAQPLSRERPAPMCAPPTGGHHASTPNAPDWPDWLLSEHRYVDLAAWVAGPHGATPAATLAYFRGVLANKQNQNLASISQLEPLLTHLDPNADSARFTVVLKTLADDYMKTYRYGDAANAFERLDRAHGAAMAHDDRADLRNDLALRRALSQAPAQQTTIPAPFRVALRRDALGLREVVVRVGSDSSGWIFDTGANLSTITDGMARRLGLTVMTTTAKTTGVTGAKVPTRVAVIPDMRVGGATVRNAIVIVLPDSTLAIPQAHFQITAILGYPVLEALGRLAIGTDSLGVDVGAGESVSDSSNLFLDELSPLVAATVGDTTRLFHFDSGADATLLTVRFCRAYPALLTGLPLKHIEIGGAGGAERYDGYEIAHVPMMIGGTRAVLDSVFVFRDASKSPFESYYGNMAGTMAAKFGGYTIDFRAMTFRLGAKPK